MRKRIRGERLRAQKVRTIQRLEPREMMANDLYPVPGTPGQKTEVRWDFLSRDKGLTGEFGLFPIDDAAGTVAGLAPGSAGYAQAALARAQTIFKSKAPGATFASLLDNGQQYGFYLLPRSSAKAWNQASAARKPDLFFSFDAANSSGFDHLRTTTGGDGSLRLNFESTRGGGDQDFNDYVFQATFRAKQAAPVPGALGQTTATTFTLDNRSASYKNEVGYFVADNAAGRIGALLPGDKGYAKAALQRSVTIFGQHDRAGLTRTIELFGGSFLGFFLVRDSNRETLLRKNPDNSSSKKPEAIFSFPAANAGKLALTSWFAENRIGFEDAKGGGDRDFNDLVMSYSFGQPPVVTAGLFRDTAPGGATNTDGLTFDPTITGNIDSTTAVTKLEARLSGGAAAFFDVTASLGAGNDYSLDTARLNQVFGGALPDGLRTIEVRATNATGQTSSVASFTFTLDRIAPALTLDLDPASDTDTVGDHETMTDPVTLRGTTEANLSVRLDGVAAPVQASGAGVFSFAGINLNPGPNPFIVRANDAAGNEGSFSQSITFVSDCPFQPDATWAEAEQGGGRAPGQIVWDDCTAELIEGDSFLVTLTKTLVVPAVPSILRFAFAGPSFDTEVDSINDAFEVALVDEQGNPLVLPIAGSRDAFFNLSEGVAPSVSPQATIEGTTVEVDLSRLTPGSTAKLIFRLVNNDGDTETSVVLNDLAVVAGDMDTPDGQGAGSELAGVAAIDFSSLEDVTGRVWGEYGRTSFNEDTHTLFTDLAVRNVGHETLAGPLLLVIDGLSDPAVAATAFDGLSPDGKPYYRLDAGPDGMLFDDEATLFRTIRLLQPEGEPFTFTWRIFAAANTPPAFTSTPPSEALVGLAFTYDSDAVDAQPGPLAYSLPVAPPGMSINAETGLVTWIPQNGDAGSQSVTIRVTDAGGLTADQSFTLLVRAEIPNRPPEITSEPVVDATVAAFFELVEVPMGPMPAGLALGDFIGDGNLSLATANAGSQTAAVAGSQGDGLFDPQIEWSLGDPSPDVWRDFYMPLDVVTGFGNPFRIDAGTLGTAKGDFNDDGALDLAVVFTEFDNGATRDGIVLQYGNNDGTFDRVQRIEIGDVGLSSLLARDFDRDGRPDLIASASKQDRVYFLKGLADGTFAPPASPGDATGYRTADDPSWALTDDLNGDGFWDLAIDHFGTSQVSILLGRGDGTFQPFTAYAMNAFPATFDLEDIDGDDDVDFVVGSWNGAHFQVWANDGAGLFTRINQFNYSYNNLPGEQFSGGDLPTSLDLMDLDDDGIVDLYSMGNFGHAVFFKGDGAGNFVAARHDVVPYGGGRWFSDNEHPDFNGDGRPDLVLGSVANSQGFNAVTVGINQGNGAFDFSRWIAGDGGEIRAANNYRQGAAYFSVVTGDFNRDGLLDIVSSSYYRGSASGGVNLLLAESPARFTTPEVFSEEVRLLDDFNNDGFDDLLFFAFSLNATFGVRLGRGGGQFDPAMPALPRVGSEFYSQVSTGDFDGDGNRDVIWIGTNGAQGGAPPRVLMAYGTGDGHFNLGSVINGGGSDLAVGDFNEDGHDDYALTSDRSNIQVWLYTPNPPVGQPPFTLHTTLTPPFAGSGGNPALVPGDFNGDGHLDLISSRTAGFEIPNVPNRLTYYAGDGHGNFGPPITWEPGTSSGNYFLRAGDLNGDGRLDLGVFNNFGHFYILLNQFDQAEGQFVTDDVYGAAFAVYDAKIEDVTQDGIPDIAVMWTSGPSIFRGNGDGTFGAVERYAQSTGGSGYAISVSDADGDGHVDLFSAQGNDADFHAGNFYTSKKPGVRGVLSGDFNGDGDLDLFVGNPRNGHVTPLFGHGDETFTRGNDLLVGYGIIAMAAEQLNADGRLDFVTANEFNDSITVMLNQGAGAWTRTDFLVGDRPTDIAIGDLNGDGRPDLAVSVAGASQVVVFFQQLDGSFAKTVFNSGFGAAGVAIGDFDGDGVVDFGVSSPAAKTFVLHRGLGGGAFATPVSIGTDLAPRDVALGDINGDGRPDVVVTYPDDGRIGILYGQAGGRFTRAQQVVVGSQPDELQLADLDGDGRVDIVVNNTDSDSAMAILNRYDPAQVYVYQPIATDPDNDPLSFALVDGPGGMSIDTATGELRWAPGGDQFGDHTVSIEVSDGRGGTATQTYTVRVGAPRDNHPPEIVSTPETTIPASAPEWSYTVRAVDADGDRLHYKLLSGPEEMTFDAATHEATWDPRGRALAFAGENTLEAPDDEWMHLTDFTIETWLRLDQQAGRVQQLFLKDDRIHLEVRPDSLLAIVRDGSNQVFLGAAFTPAMGSWHHVAIALDTAADRFSMVIDGVEVASVPTTIIPAYNEGPLYIGNGSRQNFLFGAMDEIRFWSIARTAAQIAADRTRYLTGNEPGLASYLRLDESSGNIAFDATGNSHNLVLGEFNAFPPARITSFGLERDVPVTMQVRDARGGIDLQTFTVHTTFAAPGAISGVVFDDVDGDGVRDLPGEGLLSGRTIFIDANGNGLFEAEERSAVTEADGTYSLGGLAAGTYTVALVGAPGRVTTAPAGGAASVAVAAGGTVQQAFGSRAVVGTSQRPPAFVSTAPLTAQVDLLYRYNTQVFSPDGRPVAFDLPLAPAGMAIEAATGVIVWTPGIDQLEPQRVIVRARDDRGLVALQDFFINVLAANTLPQIVSTPPAGPAGVGLPFVYPLRAIDADGDALTYSLLDAPAGATLVDRIFRWTPQGGDVRPQPYPIRVGVSDGHGTSEQIFDLTVEAAPANTNPVIDSLPRLGVRVGDVYRYEVAARDSDGDPVSYQLDIFPTGMTVSPEGVITWTSDGGLNGADLGTHPVRLVVSDGRGGTAVQDFLVELRTQGANAAPVFTSRPNSQAILGETFAYRAIASDADRDPLRYELASGPAGMAIDAITGELRWTPRADQLGPADVTLVALDPYGGEARQTFTLNVLGIGTPPLITSRPPTEGAVGRTYTYPLTIVAAAGDVPVFSLPTHPANMTIDPLTGLISWTPEIGQLGPQAVTIRVANSRGSASQAFEILVTAGAVNAPPRITTTPTGLAAVGTQYSYQVAAVDPEGETPHFELRQFPVGMTIHPDTGLLTWTPAANQTGRVFVTVAAVDSLGGAGLQTFALDVAAANTAPRITSPAPTQGTAGSSYQYDVLAVDDQFDPIFYALDDFPSGMTIDDRGRISWLSSPADLGDFPVTVRVTDARGAATLQSFVLHLAEDIQAPRLSIFSDTFAGYAGQVANLQVRATDNVGITRIVLFANGSPVPLDFLARGRITFAGSVLGDWIDLEARAYDARGNEGITTSRLRVIPSEGEGIPEAPVIAITSPAADASITTFTEVIGTATATGFTSYRLLIRPVDGTTFTEIGGGTAPVTNGLLGRIDPTLLLNDSYVLRLEVNGGIGQQTFVEQVVSVRGELKLGNFQVSFVDMSLAMGGIPISIGRTYDTLQAGREGEFGFGWRLAFRNVDLRTSVPQTSFEEFGIFGAFTPGARVYVTLPGGKREGFTFTPEIRQFFDLTIARPFFTPDPGVTSRLEVQAATLIVRNGELVSGSGQVYNPAAEEFGGGFTVSTKEGASYRINGSTGLLDSVTDPNGNRLTFTEAGITSSLGPSVAFERDALGRIVAIQDPEGQKARYAYDAAGNLVTVTDRTGNATTFGYLATPAHYLERVVDPLGRTGIRSEYDANGRLTRTIDANGKAIEVHYDPNNSLVTTTDALGNPTTLEYDSRGNIVQVTDALGHATSYTYDANNNRLTITDPLLHTTVFAYDDAGNILTKTDPLGNVSRYTYGIFNRQLSFTDPLGNTISAVYDSKGNLVSRTEADGSTTSFTTDSRGQVSSATNALGASLHVLHDGAGNVDSLVNAQGTATDYAYDANGKPLSQSMVVTTAAGPRTVEVAYTYDSAGRVLTTTNPDGGIIRSSYDAAGNLASITDALGRRTEFAYDALNRLIRTTFQDGTSTQSTYDDAGRELTTTDRGGRVTQYVYDDVGRLLRTIHPDTSFVTFEYDAAGQLITQTDELGHATHYAYDAAGRQISSTDALGKVTTYAYDVAGRLVAETDPLLHTTQYTYDARGRVTATTFADGSTIRAEYDVRGRKVADIDQLGGTTRYQYDALDQLTVVIDPLGNQTRYAYDEIGNRIRQTDANGHLTRFEYDVMGRMTAEILPLGQRSTTEYDLAGNITRTIDFNGQISTYSYDTNNRLLQQNLPGGNSVVTTYTATGERASVTQVTGATSLVTTYHYDTTDRLLSVLHPDGQTITYTYDTAGNETSVAATDVGTTLYTFDPLHRLQSVQDAQGRVTQYEYDDAGNLVRTTLPNGVVEDRGYDALNRLTSIVANGPGGLVIGQTYTLRADGKIAAIDEVGPAGHLQYAFSYDANGRLTGESIDGLGATPRTFAWTFDAVGNRLTQNDSSVGMTTYTYDANDRLVQQTQGAATTTFTYDANGNQLTSFTSAAQQASYQWDSQNRLVRADVTEGGVTATTTYAYDADGNLVARTSGGTVTRYLVDSNTDFAHVLKEYTTTGVMLVGYVYGLSLLSQVRSGAASYYHGDATGSTRVLTSAAGTTLNHYTYDALGNVLTQSEVVANTHQYLGEPYDASTGLTYLRARWLDPSTSRFVSQDPAAGNAQSPISLNHYAYAHADPLNLSDPSGKATLAEVLVRITITTILSASVAYTFTGGAVYYYTGDLDASLDAASTAGLQAGTSTLIAAAATEVFVAGVSYSFGAFIMPVGRGIIGWVTRTLGESFLRVEIQELVLTGIGSAVATAQQTLGKYVARKLTADAGRIAGNVSKAVVEAVELELRTYKQPFFTIAKNYLAYLLRKQADLIRATLIPGSPGLSGALGGLSAFSKAHLRSVATGIDHAADLIAKLV